MTGHAVQGHPVRCAEVAETIDDQMTVIEFERTGHMRAVTIDYVCTGINRCVGEFFDIAAVFAKTCLGLMGNMCILRTLAAAMERHDDDVGVLLEFPNDTADLGEVVDAESPAGCNRKK